MEDANISVQKTTVYTDLTF